MGGDAGVFSALWPAEGAALEREFLRTPSGELLRYREVHEQSARLAHALVARGVRPGDRVAVQVQKSPEALLLYFATLRAGAVYLPLNDAYTVAELEYFLGDAQPSLLVCAPERYHELQELATRLQVGAASTLPALLDVAAGQPGRFEDVARSA